VPDVSWKGFSKGSLSEHNTKHGAEFGSTGSPDYLKKAKEFGAKVGSGIQTVIEGNFLIKYEESTSTILIGHIKDREIRTFYKASPEHTKIDPLTDAINFAKSLSNPK
jgi:pyocin large subunit-like protein